MEMLAAAAPAHSLAHHPESMVFADPPGRVRVDPGPVANEPMPDGRRMAIEPNFRRLRAVLAVEEQGSITRGAVAMHRSAPAVTRAVLELEDELGLDLFERSRQGLRPTVAGLLVLARIRRAVEHLRAAEEEIAPASMLSHRVTHQHLHTVIALMESQTQTRAAQQLGLSQPAITRTLREIENLIGHPLFLRTPRGMQPTPRGEQLFRRAKLALAEVRAVADDIAAHVGQMQGKVAIGILPLSSTVLVPRAISLALADHPELRISVTEGTYDSQLAALRCGDVDLIVGALRGSTEDLKVETLFDDQLVVCVRAGHPLAGRPSITLADLPPQAWVMPKPGTPARDRFEQVFDRAGLPLPTHAVEACSLFTVRDLLLESDRAALVSPFQLHHELAAQTLCRLPIPLAESARTISFASRVDTEPTAAVRAFASYLRQASERMAAVR